MTAHRRYGCRNCTLIFESLDVLETHTCRLHPGRSTYPYREVSE